MSELIDLDYKFIPLQSKGAPLLGEVSKIIAADSGFYILDAKFLKRVLSFTANGEFICEIGKIGQAEGEYSMPKEFLVKNESIEVFDKAKYAIINYKKNGEYKSEERIPFSIHESILIDENLRLIYVPENSPYFNMYDVLYLVSNNYKEIEKSFFPYQDVIDDAPFPGFLSKNNNLITYCNILGEFYTIDNDFIVRPRFRVDFGKYNWPISKHEIISDQNKVESLFLSGGIMSISHRISETDEFLVFFTFMVDEQVNREVVEESEDTWLCILDKSKNRIIAIKEVVDDIDGGVFSFPIAVNNNRFISAINSEKFLKFYPFEKDRLSETKYDSTTMKRLGDVKIDSNPVLLEFSFNKNLFK